MGILGVFLKLRRVIELSSVTFRNLAALVMSSIALEDLVSSYSLLMTVQSLGANALNFHGALMLGWSKFGKT